MYDWVQNLLDLQDKDIRIARLQKQIDSAPAEKKEVSAMLQDAEAAVAAAAKEVQTEEKKIKELEIEAEIEREKMRNLQSKSTMIKSNDEYRAAMTQIEGCAARISKVEDRELTIMETMESSRQNLAQRKKELQAAQNRVSEMLNDLDTRVKNCTAEVEKLLKQREAAKEAVKNDIVARYERMRKGRRNGDERLFVPIRDDVCDRCHMNVTAQTRMNARKGLTVTCENCGALLYWED